MPAAIRLASMASALVNVLTLLLVLCVGAVALWVRNHSHPTRSRMRSFIG